MSDFSPVFDTFASAISEEYVIIGLLDTPRNTAIALSHGISPKMFRDYPRIVEIALNQFQESGHCSLESIEAELEEKKLNLDLSRLKEYRRLYDRRGEEYRKNVFDLHLDNLVAGHTLREYHRLSSRIGDDIFTTKPRSLRERVRLMQSGIGELMNLVAGTENTLGYTKDLAPDSIERLHKRLSGEEQIFVPTGFSEVDRLINGFKKKRITILAGRPSHGKTITAVELALRQAALQPEKQVVYFSAEMDREALTDRMIANLANVDSLQYTNNTLPDQDMRFVEPAAEKLSKMHIAIDDNPSPTTAYMMGRCVALNAEREVSLIIFDWIGYTGEDGDKRMRLEIALRGCHNIAKRMDCPFIVLMQLNRGIDARSDPTPQLSDIRETGAGENDAALVIMIYHPWTHWRQTGESNDEPSERDYGFYIRKNTHGPIGSVIMNFDRRTGRLRCDDELKAEKYW